MFLAIFRIIIVVKQREDIMHKVDPKISSSSASAREQIVKRRRDLLSKHLVFDANGFTLLQKRILGKHK
jgi:hypothetical protein